MEIRTDWTCVAFTRTTGREAREGADPLRRSASRRPGATAADGEAVTLRVHHSLVELPDTAGYDPRPVDPRAGAFGISFQDYSTPVNRELRVRWASRHRLQKEEPGAASSPSGERYHSLNRRSASS
jgi:hypothetical protein